MAKLKPDFRQSTAAMFLTLKDEPEEIQGALENENSNAVTEIPISEIDDFPDHPFHVVVDDAMNEMADNLRNEARRMYSLAKLSEQSNKRTPEKHLFSGVLAHLTGFEPVAYRLGGDRSILLSYRCLYEVGTPEAPVSASP